MPPGQRRVLVVLLSIVIVTSLVVWWFLLSEEFRKPSTPQEITLEAVEWTMVRPFDSVGLVSGTENNFTDGVASVSLVILCAQYYESYAMYGDNDALSLLITITSNVSDGFIYSVVVRFSEIDADAYLDIWGDTEDWLKPHNLTIEDYRDKFRARATEEPYVNTLGVNQPKQSLLEMLAFWIFIDEHNADHWMKVTLETTYFNGTAYRKAIISTRLGVLPPI